jgi:DNA-binding transcriptional LysR family regulator
MNWDDVQIFLAVARAGQLQGASLKLGIDRTTVGRRVAALEAQLGVPLFTRTRTGLTLTAAGHTAVTRATHMEAEAHALKTEASPPTQVSGVVRLAVTDALGPFLVEQGLLSITDVHPRLRLEVLSGNRRLDLASGEADLALRVDPLKGARLRARCVSRTPIALYAAPGYLGRRGRPRSVKALHRHDAVVPSGELAHMPEGRWLAAQCGGIAFSSNSVPALVAAARTGKGLVALTASWGDREPGLERLFDVPGVPPRALWLVSTAEASRHPACIAVSQHLVELFARVRT